MYGREKEKMKYIDVGIGMGAGLGFPSFIGHQPELRERFVRGGKETK